MPSLRKLLKASTPADLATIDPRSTPGLPKAGRKADDQKAWSATELLRLGGELSALQERLYAATRSGDDRRRLLIVLQAMDAGGKDGLVRHVGGHDVVPADVWRERYDEINAFERELVDDGVILVKIMLHISPDEQRERLAERLEDPTKYWKYNPADLGERARWHDYRAAYDEALTRCAEAAPWYVVPADRKWYRNWAVASLLVEILSAEDPQYPPPDFDAAAERKRLLKG